jgi:hypothetical protein
MINFGGRPSPVTSLGVAGFDEGDVLVDATRRDMAFAAYLTPRNQAAVRPFTNPT